MSFLDNSRYAVWTSTAVKTLGVLEMILAACLAVPALVALCLGEDPFPYFNITIPLLAIGFCQFVLFRNSSEFRPANGLLLIGLCWLELFIIGTAPYLALGFRPIDALFESISGFTTTGATLIPDTTALPMALMVWRSFTQWIGGITVILLFMYVLPMVGIGRAVLVNELSGSGSSEYTIKLEMAAKSFIFVYALFTGLNYVILFLLGVDPAEALCLTFATISTGGLMCTNDSLAGYSVAVQAVTAVFMFLGGVNFYLHYNAISKRQPGVYRNNSEFRFNVLWFVLISVVVSLMMIANTKDALSGGWEGLASGVWNSVFAVISIGTSSAFSIADYSIFPAQCLTILMLVAVIGASSGSTSGGVKISRLNVIYQFMKVTVSKTLHPNAVKDVRVDGQVLNHAAVLSAFSILMLFIATLIVGSVVIMMCGYDIQDAVGISIAMVGNLGSAFGDFGSNGSFSDTSDFLKVIMMNLMWVGRLEILTALMFFSPTFWKELWRVNRIKARWRRRIS